MRRGGREEGEGGRGGWEGGEKKLPLLLS